MFKTWSFALNFIFLSFCSLIISSFWRVQLPCFLRLWVGRACQATVASIHAIMACFLYYWSISCVTYLFWYHSRFHFYFLLVFIIFTSHYRCGILAPPALLLALYNTQTRGMSSFQGLILLWQIDLLDYNSYSRLTSMAAPSNFSLFELGLS